MRASEPPEGTHQALAGEVLPIAAQPNVHETNPVDTPYTGYGNFYALHYLNYLIGMNTAGPEYGNARPYDLRLPKDPPPESMIWSPARRCRSSWGAFESLRIPPSSCR